MSATQTTPGGTRRARPEKAYVPYNAQPKATGTRTGAAMPTNVPRMSDGFEDPDAFFRSPAGTEYSRARKSMMSVLDTPATVTSVGTSRRARGRMSQMLGDDDDEDRFDENLLADEDDVPRATPPPFFTRSNPPAVSLPRGSRLPPASPALSFGDIPSPAKSTGRRAARRTDADRLSSPPTEDELGLGADDIEANDVSQQVPVPSPSTRSRLRNSTSVSASPQKRKVSNRAQGTVSTSPRKGRKTHRDAAEDDDEPEMGRDAVNRLSMVSRRTPRKAQDSDEEDHAGPSVQYDAGELQDFDGGDVGMDDSGMNGDVDDVEDMDMDNGGEADPMEQDYGDDDEEPPAPEVYDQEEDDDASRSASPVVKKRRGRPPKAEKRAGSSKPRGYRATSQEAARAYKKRISQLEDDGNDGVSGDFTVRRSGRKHFAPLAWWRGEKFNYQRGEKLSVIKEVVKIPEEPAEPLSARYKRSRTGRSQSAKPNIKPTVDAEAGWDAETDPVGLVREYPSGKEMKRRIAFPYYQLNPQDSNAPGAAFQYQKVFGDSHFLAAGVIYLPVEGKKPGKNSKDNSYVFYVITGAVEVKVHRTSFVMGPGAMFLVPRGNHYSIENISETQVELFFAQARQLRANEPDDEADDIEGDAEDVEAAASK